MGVLAFAALVIPTGSHFWHIYQLGLQTCRETHTCSQLPKELFTSSIDGYLFTLVKAVTLAIPFLLGLFWGAPLIAKEYLEGTNKLVWTRSISRRR